ncbi:hypothetical protein C6A85_08715, partial [Mycobacterium sp. ITM-2017-0098]
RELPAAARCGRSGTRCGDLSRAGAQCRHAGIEFARADRRRRRSARANSIPAWRHWAPARDRSPHLVPDRPHRAAAGSSR